MRTRLHGIAAAVSAVLVGLAVAGTSAAQAAPASGINDWRCRPTAVHPDPVVFLHGFSANADNNSVVIAPYLARQGYCVFALTYGATSPLGPSVGGFAPIPQSAAQIAAFIDRVRAATGADKVDLVGHSEGAFLSLYVPKETGAGREIDHVVALAPMTHGINADGIVTVEDRVGLGSLVNTLLSDVCPGCTQLLPGRPAVAALDAGRVTAPGVAYTVITSTHDDAVTPTASAFIDEPGVTNEYVQAACPADPVGHGGEALDLDVAQLIGNALDPATAVPVTCGVGFPL